MKRILTVLLLSLLLLSLFSCAKTEANIEDHIWKMTTIEEKETGKIIGYARDAYPDGFEEYPYAYVQEFFCYARDGMIEISSNNTCVIHSYLGDYIATRRTKDAVHYKLIFYDYDEEQSRATAVLSTAEDENGISTPVLTIFSDTYIMRFRAE